jgi:hypothetical protein
MDEIASVRANARMWFGAFLVATFGTAALLKTGILHGWAGMALFAASFLLLIPMVRSIERARAAVGANSPAMRNYNRRMIVASLSYVALLLAGAAVARYYAPPAAVRILLALAVAAPVLFMIRAVALLLKEERDEYLRMRFVQQSLIAMGFVLTVSTLYGFLNVFDLAPRLDAYLVMPLWGVGLGIGAVYNKLTLGSGGC